MGATIIVLPTVVLQVLALALSAQQSPEAFTTASSVAATQPIPATISAAPSALLPSSPCFGFW